MAADLGLVAYAANGDALELATHCARDRSAERGLSNSGRSEQAEDRSARVGVELAHREELNQPVLDLLDVVVVVVEHLAGVLEVEIVLSALAPWERDDPLEVGPDHSVLGGSGGQALESFEFAVGSLADVIGKFGGLDLVAQVCGLGGVWV